MPGWYVLAAILLSSACDVITGLSTEGAKQLDAFVRKQNGDPCEEDFVDKFLTLLSGPLGRETESLLEAAAKVMSLPEGAALTPAIGSNGPQPEKRLKPEFNPTGWRRRRDAGEEMAAVRLLLHNLYDTLESRNPRKDTRQIWQKRTSRRYFRNSILKPKRKPLEFNPTGW